ncbi:MAG TPA: hypothetical protein VM840_07285 [Actinomycetota bacterium]|nr:hypothetical protein [Actinomycetota bacterium]
MDPRSRTLTILAALALVVAVPACSREDGRERPTRATTSPGATTDPSEGEGPDPERAADGSPGGSPDGASPRPGAPTPTPQPVPQAQPGTSNRPRLGDYTYDLSGATTSPIDPAGRSYPEGSTQRVIVQADGDVYSAHTPGVGAAASSSTTRVRWSGDGVRLLSMRLDIAGRGYECTYDPPIQILRFPIRAESYPAQTGRGRDCETTVEIRLTGREDVSVPSGTWSSWRIETKVDYRFGTQLQGTATGTNWYSPDLGFEVRGERQNSGTYQGQPFNSTANTALRAHP